MVDAWSRLNYEPEPVMAKAGRPGSRTFAELAGRRLLLAGHAVS